MEAQNIVILCGGQDQEMREIQEAASKAGVRFIDRGLRWDTAKASAYKDILKEPSGEEDYHCLSEDHGQYFKAAHEAWTNTLFVLVELEIDCELPGNCIVVDHHGTESGNPPSLQQVLSLLGTEPSKRQDMIGAMDAGYVFGLVSMGCHPSEIADFMGQSRELSTREILTAACGLTANEDAEAERDIAAAEQCNDGLIIVRRDRNTCAEITARLFGQQKAQNILILSDWTDKQTGEHKQEANFYSTGERVRAVAAKFPQGWTGGAGLNPQTSKGGEFWGKYGGQAPDTAFFGVTGDYLQVERFIRNFD